MVDVISFRVYVLVLYICNGSIVSSSDTTTRTQQLHFDCRALVLFFCPPCRKHYHMWFLCLEYIYILCARHYCYYVGLIKTKLLLFLIYFRKRREKQSAFNSVCVTLCGFFF